MLWPERSPDVHLQDRKTRLVSTATKDLLRLPSFFSPDLSFLVSISHHIAMAETQPYVAQSDAHFAENDHRGSMTKEKKHSLGGRRASMDGPVAADDLLEAMGYKSELVRSRSTLQVAFMSFVLASIPYGLSTTLYYPLVGGGPVVIIWGWLAVSLIILCVAASLGEITSVYPTAGGVYYQTFMLAAPSYRKIVSWICGWAFVVGNITITLAVNFGTTLFLTACINVFETEPGVDGAPGTGIFAGEPWQVYLIFVLITLVCNCVSAFGNRILPWLDVSKTPRGALRFVAYRIRHLPSSGPSVVSLLSSYAYSPLPKADAMTPNMCSPNSTPATVVGHPVGPSALDCSTPPMRLHLLA